MKQKNSYTTHVAGALSSEAARYAPMSAAWPNPSIEPTPNSAGSRSKLVAAYVDRYTKQLQWGNDQVLPRQDINFEAWEESHRLINEETETAWLSSLAVLDATEDDDVLGMLSAGPLEDLVEKKSMANPTPNPSIQRTSCRWLRELQEASQIKR